MKNREITFYSLLDASQLRHIEEMADEMTTESFVSLGFERKYLSHLWIWANNEAFMEKLFHISDLSKLDGIMSYQLKKYTRKMENEKDEVFSQYEIRENWLNHTIFVCKNQYNKTKNEIYNEAIKWCKVWKKEWLNSFKSDYKNTSELQDLVQSETRNMIHGIIDSIDNDKGWAYAFRSREDLNTFVDLLTCFFEQREYVLPDEVINLKKGSKTRMAERLKEIHKKLADKPLVQDKEFLFIVKTLNCFEKDSNLYKSISR